MPCLVSGKYNKVSWKVLGLAFCHLWNRYVRVISPDITSNIQCLRWCKTEYAACTPCFIEIFCIKDRESQVNKRLQTHIVLLSSIPRVSRGLHTHTPPEGGVSQMVAYRLLQVEVPEDTKRWRQLHDHGSTNGIHVVEKAILLCRKWIVCQYDGINRVVVLWLQA